MVVLEAGGTVLTEEVVVGRLVVTTGADVDSAGGEGLAGEILQAVRPKPTPTSASQRPIMANPDI